MKRETDSSWLSILEIQVQQNLLLKRMMSITIFGSFSTKSNTMLLNNLKANLIGNGYQNTRLVSDYPDEGLSEVEKSKIILELSDVNFFVFTHQGNKYGILSELEYALTSPKIRKKRVNCVIFDALCNDEPSLSKLVLDQIKTDSLEKMAYVHFRNEQELTEAARASAWKFSSEFLYNLKARNPILKERKDTKKEFNEIVTASIDEVLSSLGKNAKESIYYHIETEFDIKKDDIPNQLDNFKEALDTIFGTGGDYIETRIIENLSEKFEGNRGASKQVHSTLKEYLDGLKERKLVSFKEKET
jgi:hypothetical protein